MAPALGSIVERIGDLLAIVREHVYHPDFRCSFRIKHILPAMCPELSYEAFGIKDGGTASQALEALVTDPERLGNSAAQRIDDLRNYCRFDTWAMVNLFEALQRLATRRLA